MNNVVEAILDECCFISGGRKSGKTNLAIQLVSQLLRDNVKVKVIDASRQWLKRSNVPHYIKVGLANVNGFNYFSGSKGEIILFKDTQRSIRNNSLRRIDDVYVFANCIRTNVQDWIVRR